VVKLIILLLPFVLAIGVSLAIIAFFRTRATAWAEAAKRLRLSYQPGNLIQSPTIRGRLKGFAVEVWVTGQGGKHNTTRYKVTFPALGLGLVVRRESFIDLALDRPYIQVDDAEFDSLYLIQGDEPNHVRAYLSEARRESIDLVLSRHAKCRIGDDEIQHKSRGVERDTEEIVSVVRNLVGLAAVLTDDSLSDTPAELAALESPAEKVVTEKVSSDADRDGRMILVPVPEEPAETTVVSDLRSDAVCRELFAEERMSFETVQLFQARFEGQRVRWTGTLDRLELYHDDPILGSDPGVKAVLDLPANGEGTRIVHLVVSFSPGEEQALREVRGEELSFEGTLAQCDPYLWTVFVTDGVRVA